MGLLWNRFGAAFNEQDKQVACEAFHTSWHALNVSSDQRFAGRQAHYAKEVVARLVAAYVSRGERDPMTMSRAVIAQMTVV